MPPEELDRPRIRIITRALSRWFERSARDLAWRRTRDPYAIWVSEVMLQQTRVETVERYWDRFLARFPDLATLAAADEDEVLAQWSGLGYYRRARLLHRGARHVHEQLGDRLPRQAEDLRKIPGIGPYTAGAIAAIAFDQAAPLVDGNVARVHSRLARIRDPREQDAKHRGHWRFVERVFEHGSPRVLGQALMELGATVCTPRSPGCDGCPVRAHCSAWVAGEADSIPAPRVKRASPVSHLIALALQRGDKLLLERRPAEGLLGGLWCLPLFEGAAGAATTKARHALRRRAGEELGVGLTLAEAPGPAIKHVFSHRVWQLSPWRARAHHAVRIRGREDGRVLAWHAPGAAIDGGVPKVTRKLLDGLSWPPQAS